MSVIRDLKERGYQIHFSYLWLPNVELALSRIKERVLQGGHNVPEADVRRRFERSTANFLRHYRSLAQSWILFDAYEAPPNMIALQKEGHLRIIDPERYEFLKAAIR